MKTEELVRQLAADVAPVRRLPPPWIQAAQWLLVALISVGVVVFLVSPRADLAVKLGDARFVLEQTAAFATAVTAALAAFCTATPGHARKMALLPLVPLAFWIGSLGQSCIRAWLSYGSEGLRFAPDWVCLPAIAMVGAIPAGAMVAMLRRGAPLAPRMTVLLGALAAAAIGDFGLRLFHRQDAGLTVLIWQVGSVLVLSALAGLNGRVFLHWRHRRFPV